MRFLFALVILNTIVVCGSPAPLLGQTGDGGEAVRSPADSVRVRPLTRSDQMRLKADMATLSALELPGLRQWQRKKSARVAIFSQMALPGLGQLYNGRRIKTAIMVGVGTFYVMKIMTENRRKLRRLQARDNLPVGSLEWRNEDLFYQFHKANAGDFIWFSGAAWLIGVLDAFVDAHLFDVRTVDPAVIEGSNSQRYLGLSVEF